MPATSLPAGSVGAKSTAGFARCEQSRTNDEGTDAKVGRDEAHNDALERTAPGAGATGGSAPPLNAVFSRLGAPLMQATVPQVVEDMQVGSVRWRGAPPAEWA